MHFPNQKVTRVFFQLENSIITISIQAQLENKFFKKGGEKIYNIV